MTALDYRKPGETDTECRQRFVRFVAPAVDDALTCADCHAELANDPDAQFGICSRCWAIYSGQAVLGAPSTALIAQTSVNGRARLEAHARDPDDFEDLDAPSCDGDASDGWSRQAVQAYLVQRQTISAGAAFGASGGVDPAQECELDAAADADDCEICGGLGWLPVDGGDAFVECNCQAVP